MHARRVAVGLSVALVLVGVLVYGVGWEAVLEHLRAANPVAFAAAAGAGAVILALRGVLLRQLLGPVEGSARGGAFATAFLAGYFARSTLPWGRSTGAPVTAYLLARNSESAFEDNLAVVTVAEVFAFVASVVVGLVGLAMFVGVESPEGDLLLTLSLVAVGSLLVVGMVVVLVGQDRAHALFGALAARWDRFAERSPRLPGGRGRVRGRLEGFFATLDAVSAARRTLVAAFAVALCSWVVNALPLYFSLLALGVDAPLALSLACAPLASFGGVIPLPGGTGGIEYALAGLLVATVGLSGDLATAVTLLYRLSTYWQHVLLGGLGAIYLTVAGHPSLVELER
ncbi:flippase-like domain-containing protein [Natronobiforma cellulositropha]|uniref:flippase-like domain-containing protein n=1 Tax=Natronobiforma cellulositropha TaxID=1679076 RepID=UPI0021D5BB57|nr:flippase-like domain-containing protein [Natronobiforma cellulositropha]